MYFSQYFSQRYPRWFSLLNRPLIPILLVTSLIPVLPSCRTVQAPAVVVGENSWNREKDVVEYSIGLEKPLSAKGYLEWTSAHLQEKNLHQENPGYPEIPVYEVRYYFFNNRGYRGGYLGSVLWRRPIGDSEMLQHVSTILER